jgi:hypothetical protein
MKTLAAVVLLVALAGPAGAAPLFDIVFLLDESGSIDATRFNQEKNFAVQSANGLVFGANDTAASLIMHANSSRLIINMTTARQSFINAVNGTLAQGGSSNFTAGLTAAQNQFAMFGRPDAEKIIAVVGDGPANVDTANLVPKLDELAAQGVNIFSIGVEPGDANFMQSLVRNGGQWYPIVPNGSTAFINGMYALLNTTPGDYNFNGTVDAADYVLWRFKLNLAAWLPNDTTPGTVLPVDYDVWRANFGNAVPPSAASIPVPEPSTWLVIAVGCLAIAARHGRKRAEA